MTVDVCVTTYRNIDKLKICLSSVIERTKFVDYKLYLLANDPTEEMKLVIHDSMHIGDVAFTDRIEPIFNDTNSGSFSENNNDLASEGNGDYILFLNDDCEPLNDSWLFSMTSILDTDPNVGAVGALLLYPGKSKIQHCGVFFSHKTNNLPYHMLYKQDVSKVSNFISVPRYYQAVTGACMLVRRKDFESVGGFNKEFFYCYEDIGLCLDIKNKLGRSSVFTPNATLIHHEGISSSKNNNAKLQENIAAFRKNYTGKYFNDYEFYMQNINHMIYKVKNIPKTEE